MDVRFIENSFNRPPGITNRTKLKLLILEADEQTLDRIIEAIQLVCGADSDIRQ